MNQNMVENEKTEVPNTKEMNDKDYIGSILNVEKNLSNNYSIVLNEASNEWLYQEYFDMFTKIQTKQRELYELMFRKGWYPLEKAEDTKITQKYNQLSQEKEQLS